MSGSMLSWNQSCLDASAWPSSPACALGSLLEWTAARRLTSGTLNPASLSIRPTELSEMPMCSMSLSIDEKWAKLIGVFVSGEADYLLSGAIGNASAGAVVLPAVNGNRVDAVPGCLGNDVAHLLLAET